MRTEDNVTWSGGMRTEDIFQSDAKMVDYYERAFESLIGLTSTIYITIMEKDHIQLHKMLVFLFSRTF